MNVTKIAMLVGLERYVLYYGLVKQLLKCLVILAIKISNQYRSTLKMTFDKCPECGSIEIDIVYFGGVFYSLTCRSCTFDYVHARNEK